MTKIKSIFLFIIICFGFSPAVAEDKKPGRVEISFDYNRAARDYANNQFAVWIEDLNGNLVKTLFVTEFTASKGWKIRKETLPTWKKKANLSTLEKEDIDAISGATPKAQRLVFSWEETSGDRSVLSSGDYNYFVECNYYWEDTVLYSGRIRVGDKKNSSKAVALFSTESAKKYTLIENVTAQFIPHQ